MGFFFHFSSLHPAPYIELYTYMFKPIQILYLNFKAVLALPKMARSAQTHQNISFIFELFGALYTYVYLCPIPGNIELLLLLAI